MKKAAGIVLMMLVTAGIIYAQDITHSFSLGINSAYYFDDNKGYHINGIFAPVCYDPVPVPSGFGTETDSGRELGNGWGGVEAEVLLQHEMVIPFQLSNHHLFQDNNVSIESNLKISPVTIHIEEEVSWTPVAFLSLNVSGMMGTGWKLGSMDIYGLGLNSDGSGYIDDSNPGLVFKLSMGTTFRFDTAVLWPGDWHHIVLVADIGFLCQDYSAADSEEAWIWRNDGGENFNGWESRNRFFIGYQMPLAVNMIGFLLETEQKLGDIQSSSPMDDKGWGSDFIQMKFGPIVNIGFNDKHTLRLILQFRTQREYSQETVFYNWFQNRQSTGDFYIDLYRFAISYKYNF